MIKCCHCNASLSDDQEYCIKCGCKPMPVVKATFKRDTGFYGCATHLTLLIEKNGFSQSFAIANKSQISINLDAGVYSFSVKLGDFSKTEKNVLLKENATFTIVRERKTLFINRTS